jgi:hypothetical protein
MIGPAGRFGPAPASSDRTCVGTARVAFTHELQLTAVVSAVTILVAAAVAAAVMRHPRSA